jgi:uncharacterized protein (DUF58 family)
MHGRTLRMFALVLPSFLAAMIMIDPSRERILDAAAPFLGGLWLVMVGVVAVRFLQAVRHRAPGWPTCWDEADRLTATGAATVWIAGAALIGAGVTGFASLSVIGVLGIGTVCVAVTWSALVAPGDWPWRRAEIRRRILPARITEGDEVHEEVELAGVAIPAGMRLLATGRAMRHGAVSRYALDAAHAGATVTLRSSLGRALRGEHHAPPLALWLADVVGLTRTPVVCRAPVTFSVLPVIEQVTGARALVGAGGDAADAAPAHQLPTDGVFRIRAYVPGDDTRRIHWVRSLQQDELIVRLPDEIPQADPAVRLVLDNALRGTDLLTCRAPDELLDALVRVWLGIGKALTKTGVRVTLVAAVEHDGQVAPVARGLSARALHDAAALGARIAWQPTQPLERMLDATAARQIVVSSRPRRHAAATGASWVVVPDGLWTAADLPPPGRSKLLLPYPLGSAENRPGRVRRERRRRDQLVQDRALFSQVICWTDLTHFAGDFLARPRAGHVALEVIA